MIVIVINWLKLSLNNQISDDKQWIKMMPMLIKRPKDLCLIDFQGIQAEIEMGYLK